MVGELVAASYCSPQNAVKVLLQTGGDWEKALHFLQLGSLVNEQRVAVQQLSRAAVCSDADALMALIQMKGDSTHALHVIVQLKKTLLTEHEKAAVSHIATCTSVTFDEALLALVQSHGDPAVALSTLDRHRQQERAMRTLQPAPERPDGKSFMWPMPDDVSEDAIAYKNDMAKWEQQRHNALQRSHFDPSLFSHTPEDRLIEKMVSVGLMPPCCEKLCDKKSNSWSADDMRAMLADDNKHLRAAVEGAFTGNHLPTISFNAEHKLSGPVSESDLAYLSKLWDAAPKP